MMAADRLRTLLSLTGVAVGIFSVVAALSLVDSLRQSLQEGFAAYGGDVLFIDREPLEPDLNEDGVFRWWAYASRPPVTWREYRYLAENGQDAFSQLAYAAYGLSAVGVDGDWGLLVPQAIAQGRGFMGDELSGSLPVAVVGAETEAACGDRIWFDGVPFKVIGVFEKAGMNTVSPVDVDHVRLVPFRSLRGPVVRGSILAGGADVPQIRRLMRSCRRLTPLQPDDFALNRLSFLLDEMNSVFALAARLGWIVGLFSLLVGGFGIANMLYVSAAERRPEIGICRALGARRRVIVRQFLDEALKLSLSGGIVGIGLAALLAAILTAISGTGFSLTVSLRAIFAGLGATLALGLIFGTAPALHAARLQPVDALRIS